MSTLDVQSFVPNRRRRPGRYTSRRLNHAEIKAIEPDIEQVSCCNVFRDINTVVVICICRRWNSERRFCVSCSSKEYTRVEHKAIRQERAKHALVVGRAKRVDLRRAFSCLVGLSINAGLFKGVVSVQFD
jgi:hypothetical protein